MARFMDSRLAQSDGEAALDRDLLARAERLWGRSGDVARRHHPEDEALRLAAYIDRRLNETEAADVEASLAADVDMREVWMRSKEAVGAYEAPPSLLLRRVTAMAPDGFAAPVTFVQRMGAGLAAARPIDGLAWALAAALFVMVCLGGFELGTSSYVAARDGVSSTIQASALPFGPQSMF